MAGNRAFKHYKSAPYFWKQESKNVGTHPPSTSRVLFKLTCKSAKALLDDKTATIPYLPLLVEGQEKKKFAHELLTATTMKATTELKTYISSLRPISNVIVVTFPFKEKQGHKYISERVEAAINAGYEPLLLEELMQSFEGNLAKGLAAHLKARADSLLKTAGNAAMELLYDADIHAGRTDRTAMIPKTFGLPISIVLVLRSGPTVITT